MAQAGLHAIIGIAATRPLGDRSLFRAGIVVGSMLPDLDILVVVLATLARVDDADIVYHRTFSHSLIAATVTALAFWIFSKLVHRAYLAKLGVGLAIGMVMHIGLDLILWFRGVWLFWPFYDPTSFWPGDPEQWSPFGARFELPMEFGCFFLLFVALLLSGTVRQDPRFRVTLRWWATAQCFLFVVYFTLAALVTPGIVETAYVLPYLISLVAACILSVRAYVPNRDTQQDIKREPNMTELRDVYKLK